MFQKDTEKIQKMLEEQDYVSAPSIMMSVNLEKTLHKPLLNEEPAGVGKTEISRRLAKLAKAPFIKVEASKFTEVGYVGRDVESVIRDLTDIGMSIVKKEKQKEVES